MLYELLSSDALLLGLPQVANIESSCTLGTLAHLTA